MKRHVIVLFCVSLLAGCGGEKLADNVNADDAGQALRTAMDAWKAGKSRADLESGSPSIIMNELAWSRGWPQDRPWVHRYRSGPMGGDAQIADLVLERRCQRAIFFEDPHVARQHEADIQLLERAVTTVTDEAVCMTSPAVVLRWVAAVQRRTALRVVA